MSHVLCGPFGNAGSYFVRDSYAGKRVLLTGVTGSLGSFILERLLWTAAEVVVVIRATKIATAENRLRAMLQADVFWALRVEHSLEGLLRRISVIECDLQTFSAPQQAQDIGRIDIIIHSAASTEFHLPLPEAAKQNILPALAMFELAELLGATMVHISTAYVNSDLPDGSLVEERVYPLAFDAEQVARELLAGREPEGIMRGHKNTYAFTKRIAEVLLSKRACVSQTNVVILRPSIICVAYHGPQPGWGGGDVGPMPTWMMRLGTGVIRQRFGGDRSASRTPDTIPLDFCANAAIAAPAFLQSKGTRLLVIHSTTGGLGLNYGEASALTVDYFKKYPCKERATPTEICVRSDSSLGHYKIPLVLLLTKPLAPIPAVAKMQNKLTQLLKFRQALQQSMTPFALTTWYFQGANLAELANFSHMEVSVGADFDWYKFQRLMVYGIKKWSLRDDCSAIEEDFSQDLLVLPRSKL